MKTFNYYRYEKKHLKCTTYYVLLAISLFFFFLEAAVNASAAARASDALRTALGSENAAEEFALNIFRFELFFMITISTLNSALFYIREQGQAVPVISKYLFAPVDIKKIYRAKALLLLRGASIFFIGGLIIYFSAAGIILGAAAPLLQLLQQFGYALIFCIAAVIVLLLTDWHRSRHIV